MATKYDFKFIRGDTKYLNVRLSDASLNVDDYDCLFTVKELDDKSLDDSNALYQASISNGQITRDSSNNMFVIRFDTSNLETKSYKYDIQLKEINSGDITTVVYGTITLDDDVTKTS